MGRDTRLVVVTTGILLRRLLDDIALEGVGAVVLDEFHERTIEMDLVLGMLVRIRQTLRPDLRIVVMSATLAAEPVSRLLGDCPIVHAEGRRFPVQIRYQRRGEKRHLEESRRGTIPVRFAGDNRPRARLLARRRRNHALPERARPAGRARRPRPHAAVRRPFRRDSRTRCSMTWAGEKSSWPPTWPKRR